MKTSPDLPHPTTVVGATARDRARPPECLVVAFLHIASRRLYHFPPGGQHFLVGSDPGRSELVVRNCAEISGVHALVMLEQDRVYVCDRGSLNGTRVHGRAEQRAYLRPGDIVALGGHEFIALSRAMLAVLRELTVYVGQNEHLPRLLSLPQTQHLVLVGPRYAPLEEIALATHRVTASSASPIVSVRAPDTSHTEERVLADAINGRIYIDGRGTARRNAAPTFTNEQLDILRDPQQLTAITLGVVNIRDVDERLMERKPFVFKVPSVEERLQRGDFDKLVDAICVKWGLICRAADWPADLRQRLANHTWRRHLSQFEAVVTAVGRMWAGLDEHHAVEGLGPPQTVKGWLGELDLRRSSARTWRPR